jgi:hypothetical protein
LEKSKELSIELSFLQLNTPGRVKAIFSFSGVWFWQGVFCVYAFSSFFSAFSLHCSKKSPPFSLAYI